MKFFRVLIRLFLILLFLSIPSALLQYLRSFHNFFPGGLVTLLFYAPFFYLIYLVASGRIGPKSSSTLKTDKSHPLTPEMLSWSASRADFSDDLNHIPFDNSPDDPTSPDANQNENSVDLLSRILSEQEEKNSAHTSVIADRRPSRFPLILLSLCCAALVIALITVSVLWQRQASADSSTISNLNAQLEESVSKLQATQSRLAIAQRSSEARLDLWEAAQSELDEIKPEYDFYHDHACVVTDSGEKYHRYGCGSLNLDLFWIYNIEYARYLGYEPCSHCNPGQLVFPDGSILDLYD